MNYQRGIVFNLKLSTNLEDLMCLKIRIRGWYEKCMKYLWRLTLALGLVWGPVGCVERTCWGHRSSHWALSAVLWSVFGLWYHSSGRICRGSGCTGSAAWSKAGEGGWIMRWHKTAANTFLGKDCESLGNSFCRGEGKCHCCLAERRSLQLFLVWINLKRYNLTITEL